MNLIDQPRNIARGNAVIADIGRYDIGRQLDIVLGGGFARRTLIPHKKTPIQRRPAGRWRLARRAANKHAVGDLRERFERTIGLYYALLGNAIKEWFGVEIVVS